MNKSVFKDNRGLTLLELLVGVTILAIIVVPLLHTFIIGAGTERKSRVYSEATDTAQNLSEQIQATDPDQILSNAGLFVSGANFYTYDGTNYSLVGTAAPKITDKANKVYYLGVTDYAYGDSSFDALITLNATDAVNSTDVSVSNQMGAYLNMSDADAGAEIALQSECGGLVASLDELTMNDLTRSIVFNIAKVSGAVTDTYTIEVVFSYTGIIACTAEGESGFVNFSHTETASASVGSVAKTTDGRPVFSVYMFYDAYYRSNISETVLINNPTGSDINVFLVNINKTLTPPTIYSALLWYKYQRFDGDTPTNSLVFTNLPAGKITYRASKNDLLRKTLTVSGTLVEAKQFDRKFNVNIKLFKGGTGFTGEPIVTLDSTKLN